MLDAREAFLLGFLPHAIRSHFALAELLPQLVGEAPLAAAVAEAQHALPARGPEIVSCVLEVQSILARHKLPSAAPPRTLAEQRSFATLASAHLVSSTTPTPERAAFTAGVALGASLAELDVIRRLAALAAHGTSPALDAAHHEAIRLLSVEGPRFEEALAGPLADGARRAITELCARARHALMPISVEVASREWREHLTAAHRVEAALGWPSPREALKLRLDGKIQPRQLLAAWFAHQTWAVPCLFRDGRPHERIFQFDKSVSFLASDAAASEALRKAVAPSEDFSTLVMSGAYAFARVPDVDVLQIDAYVEPTVHYGRDQLPGIRQAASEAIGAVDVGGWLGLDVARVAAHSYYVPVHAPTEVRVFRDATGGDFEAVFTSDGACDAYLTARGHAGAMDHGMTMRMPGKLLFGKLAAAKRFFVVDPETPHARRFSPGFAALAAAT